jgi:hypothetical protein
MGRSGGKAKQQEAKKRPVANEGSDANETAKPCGDSFLEVKVLRSDTDKGVDGITVKAKPTDGKALPNGTTAKPTGIADFGKVDPKTYEVTLDLGEDLSKRFKEPEKSSATVPGGKRKKHTVTLDPIVELRIVVLGYDAKNGKDQPVAGRDWKITGPVNESGKTKADGPIKIAILQDDEKATLEVKLRDPPGPAPADAAIVSKAEDYPIKIKPDAWKDTDKAAVLPPRSDDTVKWSLTLMDLKDADNDEGVKGRLHNLGFPTDAQAEAAPTKRAVQAYQLLYEDKRDGSGAVADVKAAVKTRHDEA